MSARPPDDERTEVRDRILELYEDWQPLTGKKTWAAFARHAGVSEYSLTEWRSGRGLPDAVNLTKLLRAGAQVEPLTQPAPIAVMQEALENQRVMRDRLGSLEEKVDELVRGMTAALELLEGLQQGRRRNVK